MTTAAATTTAKIAIAGDDNVILVCDGVVVGTATWQRLFRADDRRPDSALAAAGARSRDAMTQLMPTIFCCRRDSV